MVLIISCLHHLDSSTVKKAEGMVWKCVRVYVCFELHFLATSPVRWLKNFSSLQPAQPKVWLCFAFQIWFSFALSLIPLSLREKGIKKNQSWASLIKVCILAGISQEDNQFLLPHCLKNLIMWFYSFFRAPCSFAASPSLVVLKFIFIWNCGHCISL